MDPNKTLRDFLDLLFSEDEDDAVRSEALELLDALRGWIASGGYLPTDPRSD